MHRRFQIVAVAGVLAVVLAGAAARAHPSTAARGALRHAEGQGPGGFGGRGPAAGRRVALPLRALELTDAQREQVRQLRQQHRAQTRTLVERLRAAREARHQAVEALPPDEMRIRAAVQELAQIQADLAVQHARLQADVHALLTAEQQQRLQALRAEREARLQQRQQRLEQRRLRQQQRPPA